jgi:hypothetical protein
MPCVKNTKNGDVNCNFGAPEFAFSTKAKKKKFFSRNFMSKDKIFRCTSKYPFQNFRHIEILYFFLVTGASTPVSQSGLCWFIGVDVPIIENIF